MPQPPEVPEAESPEFKSGASAAHILDLKEALLTLHNLPEHRFTSDTPVIGPLLAGFREAWLSVAARWYVWPVMQQQSTFNLGAVQSLEETAQQIEILRQEIGLLRKDTAEIRQMLTRHQQTLAEAQRQRDIIFGTLGEQQRIATADDAAVAGALRSIVARLAALETMMGLEGNATQDFGTPSSEMDED